MNDSFTLQVTPADQAQAQTFRTFALTAPADLAAADEPSGPTGSLPQPPGAHLEVRSDGEEGAETIGMFSPEELSPV